MNPQPASQKNPTQKKCRPVQAKCALFFDADSPLDFTTSTFVRRCGTKTHCASKPSRLPFKINALKSRGFAYAKETFFAKLSFRLRETPTLQSPLCPRLAYGLPPLRPRLAHDSHARGSPPARPSILPRRVLCAGAALNHTRPLNPRACRQNQREACLRSPMNP